MQRRSSRAACLALRWRMLAISCLKSRNRRLTSSNCFEADCNNREKPHLARSFVSARLMEPSESILTVQNSTKQIGIAYGCIVIFSSFGSEADSSLGLGCDKILKAIVLSNLQLTLIPGKFSLP